MSEAVDEETADVRAGEELDWPVLEGWLRSALPDLPAGPMAIVQFPRGRANLTYRLSFGERMLVLRRPPFGKTAPGAHDMAREYTILSKLWEPYNRAPRAFALCEDTSVIGAPFVVQDYRADGIVIFGEAPAGMAGLPDLGLRLATAMADALADLHRVDYRAAGLADLGRPEGFVSRQLAGWQDRWQRVASPDCSATMGQLADLLARNLPQAGRNAIIHNDYKLDNCQFAAGNPDRVVSVFDWDMATLGDPLIDVGITLAYWPHMSRAQSLGLPDKSVFARLYAERMDIDDSTLCWYEAFANWRTAVAVQQLYDRWLKGDSKDERLAGSGEAVTRMAERALAILGGRA